MPKWMAGIDAFTRGKSFGLALLLVGPNPKNLLLSLGAGTALAQLGLSTTDAVVSWIVLHHRRQHHHRRPCLLQPHRRQQGEGVARLTQRLLAVNNTAVMAVLFLLFGVKFIADALPALG
jgi:hypothetical protein